MRTILLALGIWLALGSAAYAESLGGFSNSWATPIARTYRKAPQRHLRGTEGLSTDGSRPRAWCGWYMRQIKGGGPSFNVAKNWLTYGSASGPSLGAVVVWPHHVGYIVGGGPGNWIVRSGNWGNRVADVPLNRMGRPIGFRI